MSIDDKIFFRSIELLTQNMAKNPQEEERIKIAEEIKELIEDYIIQSTK